jgi:hypothetical protein
MILCFKSGKNIFILFQKSEESSALSIFDNITDRVAETRRLLVCLLFVSQYKINCKKIFALALFCMRVSFGYGLEPLLFSHFAKCIYNWFSATFLVCICLSGLISLVLAYFSLWREFLPCALAAHNFRFFSFTVDPFPVCSIVFSLMSLFLSYIMTLAPSGSFSVQFCVKAQSSEMDLVECGINLQVYL